MKQTHKAIFPSAFSAKKCWDFIDRNRHFRTSHESIK